MYRKPFVCPTDLWSPYVCCFTHLAVYTLDLGFMSVFDDDFCERRYASRTSD